MDLLFRPLRPQMQRSAQFDRSSRAIGLAGWFSRSAIWLCILGCAVATAVGMGAGFLRGQSQTTFSLPVIDLPKPTTTGQPSVPAAHLDTPQKKELARESDELLQLARALKVEVDKTTKDTLSLTVVRKASEIEQTARKDRAGNGKG